MPHFFIILLKINLVLLLFAVAYHLVLRRLTFYVINRIFLVFGILFSTAYPLFNLTDFFSRHKAVPEFVPQLNKNVSQFVQQESVYWALLSVLFYAGVLIMFLRLTIQFISLYRMHKNSDPGQIGNYQIRILKDEVSPFSFWKTIYINPLLHQNHDLENILEHERVHVEEWHTVDIILAELSVVFYWFNPGVWLMKKAVKENIEFITDAKILKRGTDRKSYQYSLLQVGNLQPCTAIVNSFNFSDLKMRIKMMNARRSSPLKLSRYLFVLPALLLITLAFTIKKTEKELLPFKEAVIQSANVIHANVNLKSAVDIVSGNVKAKKRNANPILNSKKEPIINTVLSSDRHSDSVKNGLRVIKDEERAIKLSGIVSSIGKDNNRVVKKIIISGADTVINKSVVAIRMVNLSNGKDSDKKISKGNNVIIAVKYAGSADSAVRNDLIFLDGQRISNDELKTKVNPENIKAIEIKKGTPENGRSGKGVYIRTKDY